MLYPNHTFYKALIFFLFFSVLIFGQDTTKILIFKFQDISTIRNNYSNQEDNISLEIESKLNSSKEIIFKTALYDSLDRNYVDSMVNISGRPSDETIRTIISKVKKPFDYLLMGSYQIDGYDFYILNGFLFDLKREVKEYQFQITGRVAVTNEDGRVPRLPGDVVDEITTKIQKELELYFGGRIRIGILSFKSTDKEFNPKNSYLEESLPSMLISYLNKTGRFKLIETKLEEEIARLLGKKDTLDPKDITERYQLNYIISGDFCQTNEKFRVDVRCIGRTGEILYADGFNLDSLDLNNLSSSLQELTAKMSSAIKKDFSPHELKTKSIAVVAFPPIPNNRSGTYKSIYMQRTIVNKLRFVQDLRVKNNEEIIENYLIKGDEKYKICSDLGVSNLLVIQRQEFEDESMMVTYDLFSMDNPTLELMRDSKYVATDSVDIFLHELVLNTINALNITNSVELKKIEDKIEGITVPKYLNQWTIGLKGSRVIRANESVYISDGLGDYYEGFLTYHLNQRSKLEFQLGYDLGKKSKTSYGKEVRVSSTYVGGLFNYEFYRLNKIGFYAGAGPCLIWIFRGFVNNQNITEEKGKGAAGITALAGIEIKISDFGVSVFLEPRYIFTSKIGEGVTTSEFVFPSGRLGGFYLTLGIGYSFNL